MLRDILQAVLPYSGGYQNGLSNHLPMALQALAELGADEGALRIRARRHGHLERLDDDGRDIDDAGGWLGDPGSEAAWRRRLAWERRNGEWHRLWPERLRLLWSAPISGGLHGLIRLAYARRGGVEAEVDAALAYALSHWLRLDLEAHRAELSLPALLASWQASPPRLPPESRLIWQDIVLALALPEVAAGMPAGLLADARELRRLALRLFLVSRDFDALHLVTLWEALLSLARMEGLAEVPDEAARQMQAAWLGVYVYCGCPTLPERSGGGPEDAAEIRRQARRQDNEHALKLALSALRLAELDGDAAWLALAADTAAHGWRGARA
ncbi:hypothetical protein [Chromobacterium phragmitis]|uniref:DUF4243 domain-containing protein n=1 Tax=Chromobacterium phragmitis TaxID=2202141 RepID=A0ABV0IW65_9NEIS